MKDNHRVVLVTGASSGIGKCCAEYLCNKGYCVYGTSRNADSIDNGRTPPGPNSIRMIRMDVTDESSVNQGIGHIIASESRIDVVINNAGFGIIGALEDTSIEEAKSQLDTNLFGALRICRSVLPAMRNRLSGYIVNISSIGGQIGLPFQSAYSASKFALEGAMEALRLEVKPYGIHVVLIEPGDFRTDITNNRRKTTESIQNSVYRDKFESALKVVESGERNGHGPEPIAKLVYRIINRKSHRIRYTTGTIHQRAAITVKNLLPARLFEYLILNNFRSV